MKESHKNCSSPTTYQHKCFSWILENLGKIDWMHASSWKFFLHVNYGNVINIYSRQNFVTSCPLTSTPKATIFDSYEGLQAVSKTANWVFHCKSQPKPSTCSIFNKEFFPLCGITEKDFIFESSVSHLRLYLSLSFKMFHNSEMSAPRNLHECFVSCINVDRQIIYSKKCRN